LVLYMSDCTDCGLVFFFFSSRRRHTRSKRDWSSDVCSSDLPGAPGNNTTPAMFSYNFGTITISDVNNNSPGKVLPSQNWKIGTRSEEHTSELQSRFDLVCRLLLEKKNYEKKDYKICYSCYHR